jgi:hypothetical protein
MLTSSSCSPLTRTAVFGQQLRELLQRALCLGDRSHLDPVAEQHDGDERRELFPERHAREAERHRRAEDECDADREGDQGHHSRECRESKRVLEHVAPNQRWNGRANVIQNLSRNIATLWAGVFVVRIGCAVRAVTAVGVLSARNAVAAARVVVVFVTNV